MEKDSGVFFRSFKDKITDYADLKLEYLKLSSYEILGKAAGKLSYGLILILAGLGAVLFFLLATAFFLGELFHSFGLGFLCVTLFFVLVIGLVVLNKTWIKTKIINKCLEGITKLEEELDNGDNSTEVTDNIPDTTGEIVLTEERDQTAE
ncbi:MAG: hypothetical protein LIP01_02430 [Tannerellaceae bacterium]|nr:hypothetical protein [Tannerellaceae bacterium]